jgi:hypothetical protein
VYALLDYINRCCSSLGIWEGTNNDPYGGTWVEVGMEVHSNYNIMGYYWADLRPNSSYYSHPLSGTPVNGNYDSYEIAYTGTNAWGVFRNGQKVGTSYPNPAYSRYMATGLESTSANDHSGGSYSAFLEYAQTNGAWTTRWASGTLEYCNYPAIAYWSTPYVTIYDEE